MAEDSNSQEKIAKEAIKHALKALRKRHLVEEGAYALSFAALSRPTTSDEYSEIKMELEEKTEALEVLKSENTALKAQVEEMTNEVKNVEEKS